MNQVIGSRIVVTLAFAALVLSGLACSWILNAKGSAAACFNRKLQAIGNLEL
jgi:hypothetical protein